MTPRTYSPVGRRATLAALVVLALLAGALPLLAPPGAAITEYRYEPVATPPTPLDYKGVAWSPDGSEAMVVGGVQAVLRYDPGSRVALSVGGTNWSTPSQSLEDVTYTRSRTAYVSGGHFGASQVLGDVWRVEGSYIGRVDSIEGDILEAVAGLPSGQVLAISTMGSVQRLVDGTLETVGKVGDVILYDLAWSPDGSGAFIVGAAGTVAWFDASEGTLMEVPFTSTHPLYSVSWRPGTDVAWAVGEGTLVVELNATTLSASRVRPFTPRTASLYGVAWHPQGHLALLVGEEGATSLWRSNVFTEQLVTVGVDLLDAMWNPKGDEALVAGADGTLLRYAPRVPPQNRAPSAVISSPSDGVEVDEGTVLTFDGSDSSDPDGDPMTMTWSTNVTGLFGSGPVVRHSLPLGVHTVSLHVDDGQGHNVTDQVAVTVRRPVPPERRLHLVIETPIAGSLLRGTVVVSGTASYELGSITSVDVSIDGQGWRVAEGTASWSLSLDTTLMEDGVHTIIVRALAEDGITKNATVLVEVRNVLPPEPPEIPNVTLRLRERGVVDQPMEFQAEAEDLSPWLLVWSFGDGSNAQGSQVRHAYRSPGRYEVSLELWLEGSSEPTAVFTTTVIIEKSAYEGPSLEGVVALMAVLAVVIYIAGFYGGRRALRGRR